MAAYVFIALAGAIHVWIFFMESVLWGKPKTNRVFRVTPEQAQTNRGFAFNQGFYNLFLAIAALAGIVSTMRGNETVGTTLMVYSMASMLGAALVLLASERRLFRAAMIQGVPPLIGLLLLLFT